MSNFAAMRAFVLEELTGAIKATSQIIDVFLEIAYAFLEVCVRYGMWLQVGALERLQSAKPH
jgi:hypothetical protein